MSEQYTIKIALEVGFRNDKVKEKPFNQNVNKLVLEKKPNVLTIRMAEQKMLYYIVSDFKGNVLEQGDLNVITTKHGDISFITDYKNLLIKKEEAFKEGQRCWDSVQNIKDFKRGYITEAVSRIVQIQRKYDAVIVTEDFNGDFVDKRRRNLKSTYQMFQQMLVARYSLVLNSDGKYAEGRQSSYEISTIKDMKRQAGIVYFASASYISKTDFTTAFYNDINDDFYYENLKKAKETISNMTVEPDGDDYKITYKGKILYTKGERTIYRNKKTEDYNCSMELKTLLSNYHIEKWDTDFSADEVDAAFYKKLFEIINVMLRMHYYDSNAEEDYMLSPVYGGIDTRHNKTFVNSASAKTYMLFIKWLLMLESLNEETGEWVIPKKKSKKDYEERYVKYLQSFVSKRLEQS